MALPLDTIAMPELVHGGKMVYTGALLLYLGATRYSEETL